MRGGGGFILEPSPLNGRIVSPPKRLATISLGEIYGSGIRANTNFEVG